MSKTKNLKKREDRIKKIKMKKDLISNEKESAMQHLFFNYEGRGVPQMK